MDSDPTREQYIASEMRRAVKKLLEINDIKFPEACYRTKADDLGDMYKILDSAVTILTSAKNSGIYT